MEDVMEEKSFDADDVEDRIQVIKDLKNALVQKGIASAIFGDFDLKMASLKTSISRFIGYLRKSEEARYDERWWINYGSWVTRISKDVDDMDSLLDSIETKLNSADAAFGNGDMNTVRSEIDSINYKRVADFDSDGQSLVQLKYWEKK